MIASFPQPKEQVSINNEEILPTLRPELMNEYLEDKKLIQAKKFQKSCCPEITNLDLQCLSYNPKHWSNESETLKLIDEVLVPHIEKVKKEKSLPDSQKSLLLWDAFKAQSTQKVKDALSANKIEFVMVPKNMTHLLQPLDLTTNASFKKFEKRILKVFY